MTNYRIKYAPKSYDEIVLHDPTNSIRPLLDKIARGQNSANLLLFGANGAGKTALAKMLTKAFYASNGSSDYTCFWDMTQAGVSQKLRQATLLIPGSYTNVQWHILDEVDKCQNKGIYNELHPILQNEHGHCFILTTNNILDMPKGIRSRCLPFPIQAPTPTEFLPRAMSIVSAEGKIFSQQQVLNTLSAVEQDLRRYLTALEFM